MDALQEGIMFTLCKLERIFLPTFFTIMIHLTFHLPQEARLAGPVHTRWMYPFERALGNLKKYVRNRARPEGSIAEGCCINEALTYCSMYLHDIETHFNRVERNFDYDQATRPTSSLSAFRQLTRPIGGKRSMLLLDDERKKKVHWYILHNSTELQSYLEYDIPILILF